MTWATRSLFAAFFDRLNKDGITTANTLFVLSADEGDHFVGGQPSPANCEGVTTPCTYQQIGELNVNLTALLATAGITAPFAVHADSAPTIYLNGNPAADAPVTRAFERAVAGLVVTNTLTNKTEPLMSYLAGPAEMKLLHMVTADSKRTPTFTLFAKPDYFVATGKSDCGGPCVTENPAFAWNHGDVSTDVDTTWLGLVGPRVPHAGRNDTVWADHADNRPTMLALLGLKDDYPHDGRVLFEMLDDAVLPQSLKASRAQLTQLAEVYKQIDAPVGLLGLASLATSTRALQASEADDSTYTQVTGQLATLTAQRDGMVAQMSAMLEGVAFENQAVDGAQAQTLIQQAQALLDQAKGMQ